MKCDNWIDPRKVGKKGQLLKAAFIGTIEANPKTIRELYPQAEPCQGNIIATVAVENEPYMGGTSATLAVEYRCDRCKEFIYGPHLPREDDELSAILTKYIALQDQPAGT